MSTQSLKLGWKMVKFGEVVKNANLVERDPEANGIERIVGLDHIVPENLHIRRWNSVANGTSFTRKFVPGQTLFGKRRAYQRKVAYAEFEGICSGDILTFESKNSKVLLPELLPFICQSDAFFDHALGTSAGSLSPRTSWTALKDFEFPLPPLDEQKRIAEILWAADEVICSQHNLVTDVRNAQLVFFESRMKVDSANQALLGDALQTIVAGKSPQGASRPANEDEFGVLKVSAVGNNCFVETENKALVKQANFNDEYEVKPGFILVTRANALPTGVGRPCVVKSVRPGLMLSDKTLRLVPNEESVLERFLYQNLLSRTYRKYVETAAGGTEAKNISQDRLKKAPIWLPSLGTQKAVTKTLLSFDQTIEHAETSLMNAQSMLRTLNSNWGEVLHV
ncbi:MAG: restriction endonuclease subunit S [Sedimenticola sp.]